MFGGEVLTLIDVLEEVGIAFMLVKHENSGGFIVEGLHYCDGVFAILVAMVGLGAMNVVNVVANAEQDWVLMILLMGCVDEDEVLTYTYQVLDHQAVFCFIIKGSFCLSVVGAGIIVDKVVFIVIELCCGLVHIDVLISVADAFFLDGVLELLHPVLSLVALSGADVAWV